VFLVLVGRPLATDDLWWHLELGGVYASQGLEVPQDPMLHTTREHPTVPHEWLFQVALHNLQRGVGFQGLRVIHVAVVAGLLLWAFALFRGAAGSTAPAALATLAWLALSWYRLFQLRPELATLTALFAFYALLFGSDRPPSWGRVVLALGLLVVWANAHSLFAIGPALVLAALAGMTLQQLAARRVSGAAELGDGGLWLRRLAVVLVLGLLVTAANPRGFEQHLTFLQESSSGDIWHLQDDFLPWNPFLPPQRRALTLYSWIVADALLLGFLATAGVGLRRLWRERSAVALRDLDALHLALGGAAFVAMLVAARFHWLGFLPLLYLLRASRRASRAWTDARRRTLGRSCAAASAGLALAFPVGIHLDAYVREVGFERNGYLGSPYLDARYCGAGMRFLRDARLRGRLFHPFNLGGFLGYWLAPGLRTFIDGRMDHYPSEVLKDYLAIRSAAQVGALRELSVLLDKWKVDLFFGTTFPRDRYPGGSWTDQLRRLHSWVPVFASQDCAIYLRRDPRNERNLERARRYYRERKLRFDEVHGVDVGAAIRRRPGWVEEQGLVPPHFEELWAARKSVDPAIRVAALDELGQLFWRVGAFREAIAIDQVLLAQRPELPEPQRRMADALLQLGRPAEALAVADALRRSHPGYGDVDVIYQLAASRVEPLPGPPKQSGADP